MAIRVLVIDDEQDFLDIMAAWLQFKGYDVATARDGLDGLERLREGKFDLILLDLMMPRLNGWDFCREVRGDEAHKHIPILVLTAARRVNGLQDPTQFGADALLEKMAGHDELHAVMEKIMAAKKNGATVVDAGDTLQ